MTSHFEASTVIGYIFYLCNILHVSNKENCWVIPISKYKHAVAKFFNMLVIFRTSTFGNRLQNYIKNSLKDKNLKYKLISATNVEYMIVFI